MASSDATGPGTRYGEAVLLGLLAHELVAGVVFWAIGLSWAAGFLWVVGTGLALGYALIWLARQLRAPRHRARLAIAIAVLAVMIAATAVAAFVISAALGAVLIAAVFLTDRRSDPSDHSHGTSRLPWLGGQPANAAGRSRQRNGA